MAAEADTSGAAVSNDGLAMAKIKLTKTELKAQTDALKRFQRFLPMLQLKKQQLPRYYLRRPGRRRLLQLGNRAQACDLSKLSKRT